MAGAEAPEVTAHQRRAAGAQAPRSLWKAALQWERNWWHTPGKLRVLRAILATVCVVAGVSVGLDAGGRRDTATEIARRTQPLNDRAIDVYRALADADATVLSEYLPGPVPPGLRAKYDEDVTVAATRLAEAGTQAGDEGLTANRIADISAELPVYTSLVGAARGSGGSSPEAINYLRRASEVMQSRLLRRAQALQRSESARLDSEYARAMSRSTPAAVLVVLALVGLVFAQLFLAVKSKRILNRGLLLATLALFGASLWWTVSSSASGRELDRSRRHSEASTDALGQAQIAALQARASELLSLASTPPTPYDDQFSDRTLRLARRSLDPPPAVGAGPGSGGFPGAGGVLAGGGSLGAAEALASDAGRVQMARTATQEWLDAHAAMRTVRDNGRPDLAVAWAVDPTQGGTAAKFSTLDRILGEAVDEERVAFAKRIEEAQRVMNGVGWGTALLGLVAAAGTVWGMSERLEDYR